VAGDQVTVSVGEGLQAIVFFTGQVVINNFDIVLVKHFFPAEEAGLYAAVALVGRLVYMCAWSVASSLFPLSAGTRSEDREGRGLLLTSLLLVLLLLLFVIVTLWVLPDVLWNALFGAQFALTRYGSISSLLMLYAITTGVYSLSAVIIVYEMSRKIGNTGWIQLAFSGAIILGIYALHGSLHQVILVQLALMLVLLAVVLLPFLQSIVLAPPGGMRKRYSTIRKLGWLSEEAVITEFLRNELHHQEFDAYREQLEHIVSQPDLRNAAENDLRRALLFLRRGAMWRELPEDTQWFEVELKPGDLDRIRVFPRAQWRRFARGNFRLTDIVERIRVYSGTDSDEFVHKLRVLSEVVRRGVENPAVLLIGVDSTGPLTILDGNHRMAAAMLAAPPVTFQQFRFICGFSPKMTECCWYQTNLTTLWRYAKNLVRYMPYDPESDIGRFLQTRTEG
jgi:hypothetical protein